LALSPFGMSRFDRHTEFDLDDSQPVIATVASGIQYRGKDAARRQIRLLTGDANTRMHFNLVPKHDARAAEVTLDGPLNAHWEMIVSAALKGFAPHIVVNEGGRSDRTVRRVRALFVEGKGVELPTMWHRQPNFVVVGDDTQWCAYWIVRAFPIEDFTSTQARLAAMYDIEIRGNRLARMAPLAGVKHPIDASRSDEMILVEWLPRRPT
jgi:hypothetical protein